MFVNPVYRKILILLTAGVVNLYFYTLLHEGGHALVALACGGKVEQFVLGFNAHVRTSGTAFTPLTASISAAAGVMLPVLFLLVALLFYKPGKKNEYYHLFYGITSIGITSSLLAWVFIPLLALFGKAVEGDDATGFLIHSGFHPLVLVVSALLIITLLLMMIHKKGILRKLWDLFRSYRAAARAEQIKTAPLLKWLIVAALPAFFIAGFYFARPVSVMETNVTLEISQPVQTHTIAFSTPKSKTYAMSLDLQSSGFITDIQVYDQQGERVYQNMAEWFRLQTRIFLEKGDYRMVLTFLPDPLQLEYHWVSMGYSNPEKVESLLTLYREDVSEPEMVNFRAKIK